MKIWSYVISSRDDADTLWDAMLSLSPFSDRTFVIDGGNVSLIHHERHSQPLREWLYERPGHGGFLSEVVDIPFVDYGQQRNATLEYLKKLPDQPDWLVWIDADEVCSFEMTHGIRNYLASVPKDCSGVYVKWLNLAQDENHCANSDWLAHPRIVKVDNHYWSGSVHEHMLIDRDKLARWDVRIIHTRALYRRRLLVQRSHCRLVGRSTIKPEMPPFWGSAEMQDIPSGVTWPTLHWPDDEIPLPFNADALETWDELGNLRPNSDNL